MSHFSRREPTPEEYERLCIACQAFIEAIADYGREFQGFGQTRETDPAYNMLLQSPLSISARVQRHWRIAARLHSMLSRLNFHGRIILSIPVFPRQARYDDKAGGRYYFRASTDRLNAVKRVVLDAHQLGFLATFPFERAKCFDDANPMGTARRLESVLADTLAPAMLAADVIHATAISMMRFGIGTKNTATKSKADDRLPLVIVDGKDIAILSVLEKSKRVMVTAEIVASLDEYSGGRLGDKTVNKRLQRMRVEGLVRRPNGINGGHCITAKGIEHLPNYSLVTD